MKLTERMSIQKLREIVAIKDLDEDSKTNILDASFSNKDIVVWFDENGAVKYVDTLMTGFEFVD